MKKLRRYIPAHIRSYWKNYLFQTALATLVIFIIMLLLNFDEDPVIIASLGASTFIVFAMPHYRTAHIRNLLGGQLIGLACGTAVLLIPWPEMPELIENAVIYSTAVGLGMVLMILFNMEHPPAAGTALGIAMHPVSLFAIITVIAAVIFLALVHQLFRKTLRDLTW